MYETFYGLRAKPFSLTPDPHFLYLTRHHAMALTMLEYGLTQQAGFILITGEVGSGKTTLIRHLLGHLEQDFTVGLISNTHHNFGDLLQWVALAFGIDFKGKEHVELYQALVDFLIEQYGKGQRVVLIVDEAQNLNARTLEELRVLSNINADRHFVLQIVLVGQPELRDKFRRPELRQFAQRISVDYHLRALQREETHAYVQHRLNVAGAGEEILEPDAIEFVHARTGGIPRLINSLCDTALVYGFAEQRRRIDAELMAQVVRDRGANGVMPLLADSSAAGLS
ncbi:MAG TPA: AAA family ATPase [Steroidobacteraceae bacterium]|nr:AAA family ATPase [Steroidobacteraceae bacterium]